MKKSVKIFLITLTSLLAVVIVTISIAIWFVFTPEKLTPIVRKQAAKFITCQSEIGEVELTFFSTFPKFGLKLNHFALVNPAAKAPSDTLLSLSQVVGIVDVMAWWKKDELIINELTLSDGSINIFTDSLGHTNYRITKPDTIASPETKPGAMPKLIEIENVDLKNIDLSYIDLSLKLNTDIRNLTAEISGTIKRDTITSNIKVKNSTVSVQYEGEKYLQSASVKFDMLSDIIQSGSVMKINEGSGSVNGLEFKMNGSVGYDTRNQDIALDLGYNVKPSPIDQLLKLVPPSYQSYFKGVEVNGSLSSDGKIKGIYNDTHWPVCDIHLLMENGTLKYAGFPIPLHDMNGDINLRTDLTTDSLSFVQINRFDAKTPNSTFSTKGLVNHLFTDIFCKLTTNADLTLDEFNPMVPANMKVKLKGKAQGQVESAFSMSQVEKMQVEKMKLSGSVTLSGFDAAYDSLSLKTDQSKIEFALPNPNASLSKTKFVWSRITSKNLEANKLKSYHAKLQNALIEMETSDMRDTKRIPDLVCSFLIDSLSAGMDTMNIVVVKPAGKIGISPKLAKPDQPTIRLAFNSNKIEAEMGQNMVSIKRLNIETDIVNDKDQKDIFLQWLTKGFVDLDKATISIDGFTDPIKIPSIKMNFSPESINIKEGKILIDQSDFQLEGNLNNILSYFRGDSILRGNLSFNSNMTDVLRLMGLTSGIGSKEEKHDIEDSKSTYTGPYMVPKGIDISLKTDIKNASFGMDSAKNIQGTVRVHDGILLLDDVTLTTAAARMQLTAMYRTPRKNHLFLGLDYHLFDVEIAELLKMIPDIDTLMPMLRSFGGKGEFHIAVETYLDSLYNLKKSTLRGASSIKGQDLVLMDGETFSEIAKTLKFNKKTVNRVDSLSAEFTIFRDEIDVYPFLLVMDKYKAVVAGRHNFDLSFNYHISVVDCPLPIKLGIDVKGTMDNMSYSLAKCKYAELYRPSSRHVVENKQLELRKMIRDALTQRVKQ